MFICVANSWVFSTSSVFFVHPEPKHPQGWWLGFEMLTRALDSLFPDVFTPNKHVLTCYHIQVLVLSQTDNIFSDWWEVWSLADLFCFLCVYIASVSRGSVGCMQRSEDTCSSWFSSSTMWVRPSGLTVSTSPVPSALFSMEFLRVLTRVLEVNGYCQITQFSIH